MSFVGMLRGLHARNAHRDPPNVRERARPARERPGLRCTELSGAARACAASRARTLASTTLRNCSGSAAPVPLGSEVPLAPLRRSLCTKLGRGSPAPDASHQSRETKRAARVCTRDRKSNAHPPPAPSLPFSPPHPSLLPSFPPISRGAVFSPGNDFHLFTPLFSSFRVPSPFTSSFTLQRCKPMMYSNVKNLVQGRKYPVKHAKTTRK